jgi:hypothetical protein
MPYIPLPAYRAPDPIDFTSINNAFTQIGQTNYRNALLDNDQQKFAADQRQRQLENSRADKRLGMDTETHNLDTFGTMVKQVAGISQAAIDAPPAQQAALMNQAYALHPEIRDRLVKAGMDPNDYANTAKFLVAQSAGYQNPLDVAAKRIDIEKGLVDIDAQKAKNSQNDIITRILNGDDPSAPYKATGPDARGTPQPAPSVQPQSYYGSPVNPALQPAMYDGNPTVPGNALAAGPQSNVRAPFNAFAAGPAGAQPMPGNALARDPSVQPGPTLARAGMAPRNALADGAMLNPALQFVSDDSGPQSLPPSPAAPAQAQPDLVDTPLGKMTKLRAQRLGLGLSLAGKGDAGKLLVDAASSNALDKAASTQNDKEELAATGQLATLNNIKNAFDAKYLNIPNRISLWGKALQEKLGTLNADDQKDLAGYTQFRQASWHNLNRILKDLSGTAVTQNEMDRQLLDQPNPGQGFGDGDSPTEFATKLRGEMAFAHSAIARSRWLRTKGFTGKPWESGVSIDDMPAIIKERGDELYQQLQQANPKADPTQLQQSVQKNLKKEFGI